MQSDWGSWTILGRSYETLHSDIIGQIGGSKTQNKILHSEKIFPENLKKNDEKKSWISSYKTPHGYIFLDLVNLSLRPLD